MISQTPSTMARVTSDGPGHAITMTPATTLSAPMKPIQPRCGSSMVRYRGVDVRDAVGHPVDADEQGQGDH